MGLRGLMASGGLLIRDRRRMDKTPSCPSTPCLRRSSARRS